MVDLKEIFLGDSGVFAWFSSIFSVLSRPIISYGPLSISILNILIGFILIGVIINLFWKGGRA